MRASFVAAAVVASLSGCAIQPTYRPAAMSPRSTQVTDTQYDPMVSVLSAETFAGDYYGVPETTTSLFSAYDKKDRTVRHAVLFVSRYGGRGWHFWSYAATSDAQSLAVTVLSRDVGSCQQYTGCDHTEKLSAAVPAETMTAAADNGLSVRFRDRSGAERFADFSPEQVKDHIRALDAAAARYR